MSKIGLVYPVHIGSWLGQGWAHGTTRPTFFYKAPSWISLLHSFFMLHVSLYEPPPFHPWAHTPKPQCHLQGKKGIHHIIAWIYFSSSWVNYGISIKGLKSFYLVLSKQIETIKNLHSTTPWLCIVETVYRMNKIILLLRDYMFCGEHPYHMCDFFLQAVVNYFKIFVSTSFSMRQKEKEKENNVIAW